MIDADRCVQCGACIARRPATPSGSAPTACPSWSRCAPDARCAGTAPAAACATRPPGRCRWPDRTGPVEDHRRRRGGWSGPRPGGGDLHRPGAAAGAGRPGRRRGQRPADRAAGGRRPGRRAAGPREPHRALEGGEPFPGQDPGPGDRVCRQPTARPWPWRPSTSKAMTCRPSRESPSSGHHARSRRSGPCRLAPGPGALPGRRGRPDHRPAVHQELQLREVNGRGGAAPTGIPLEQVGEVDRPQPDDRGGRRPRSWSTSRSAISTGAALKGCDECADFLGHAADLSIGSVGSEDGYSSVLVRTPTGRIAFERVRDRLGAARPGPVERCTSWTWRPPRCARGLGDRSIRRRRCSSTSPSTSTTTPAPTGPRWCATGERHDRPVAPGGAGRAARDPSADRGGRRTGQSGRRRRVLDRRPPLGALGPGAGARGHGPGPASAGS